MNSNKLTRCYKPLDYNKERLLEENNVEIFLLFNIHQCKRIKATVFC